MNAVFGRYMAHEVAEWFPLLGDAELRELATSIQREGQIEACVVWGDVLVDGRNRWRACELAGVEPRVVAREFADDRTCGRWIVAVNLQRRHLATAQRSMLAARAIPLYEGAARERQAAAGGDRKSLAANLPQAIVREDFDETSARGEAAEAFGVSPRSVQSARAVLDRGTAGLIAAVDAGNVSISAAAQIAKLPEAEQAEVVAAGPAAVRDVAAEIRKTPANFTSLSELWFTPSTVIEAARELLGSFDLDPASCAEANETVGAAAFYTQADDGLSLSWHGRVWCNPPYGRDDDSVSNQAKWSAYMADEYDAGNVEAGCLLVTFVPDRLWFERLWDYPMCAFRNRLKFRTPGGNVPGSPTSANVVVYFGEDVEAFARIFSRFGRVLVPRGSLTEVVDAAT